ncbi:MAG: tetratricopeptide repeat protein [bacterium]|nr:tetratricopeptide repeat protein [bacterium]
MTRSDPHASSSGVPDSQLGLRLAQTVLGLVPLLLLPGVDEFTLLPKLLALQLAALVAGAFWAFRLRGQYVLSSAVYLPALVLLFVYAASVFWAINPFRSTYDLSKNLSFFLFFFILHQTLRPAHLPGILRISAAVGLLVALLGIGEYLGFVPGWIPSTGRPSATFGYRNLAAFYLIANLPLAGLLFLTANRPSDRLLGSASAALMFVFLLYTRTRGSWVGLLGATVLVLGVWTLVSRKSLLEDIKNVFDRRALLLGGLALLVVAALGPLNPGFQEHHTQRFDEKKADLTSAASSIFKKGGDRDRFYMWQKTLLMIRDNPILGVGLGNWELAYPPYDGGKLIQPEHNPLRPHNDFLWIWSETGTLGLLAYLALLGIFFRSAISLFRNGADMHSRLCALMFSISLFSVVGAGCFSFPRERIPPSMLFWFALAAVAMLNQPTESSAFSRRTSRWIVLLVPFLLLFCLSITALRTGFDYYYVRQTLAFKQKNYPAMVYYGQQALRLGPFNHQAFIMKGEGHLGLKEYDLAEKNYRLCLTYHPNFSNAVSNLGLLHDKKAQLDSALVYYRKALVMAPLHYTARYNMGTVFQRQNQQDSAMVAYRQAYRPHRAQPYVNLGVIYLEKNQPDSTLAISLRAVNAGVPAIEAYLNLGRAYVDLHRYEEAVEAYLNFLALYKGTESEYVTAAREELAGAYSALGIQAHNRGQLDRAVELNRTALHYWPDSAIIWFNQGNVLRAKGAWSDAVRTYQNALAQDSTSADTHNNLGLAYAELRQYEQALDAYQKALHLKPDQPIVYYNIGQIYAAQQKRTLARKAYRNFQTHWKGDPATLQYHLGNAYKGLGDLPAALGAYEQYRKLQPEDPLIYYYIGQIQADMGNRHKAIEAYRGFLKRWQGDPAQAEEVRRIIDQLSTP